MPRARPPRRSPGPDDKPGPAYTTVRSPDPGRSPEQPRSTLLRAPSSPAGPVERRVRPVALLAVTIQTVPARLPRLHPGEERRVPPVAESGGNPLLELERPPRKTEPDVPA